ncbi:unnamed protein product [Sphagnum troendelagicum]|uniref:Uncharacterized protein n=1 Tax=Sphagnum jensenii TaxID=128206 RepID=A0ABP0WKV5_9BRYO
MVFQTYVRRFRAALGPIDPGSLMSPLAGHSWRSSSFSRSGLMGALLFAYGEANNVKSNLVKRFFLAAWGEACMLAEWFLLS